MEQLSLFDNKQEKTKKRGKSTNKKDNSLNKYIQQMNTIPHIYRLRSLCKIYNRLFLLTFEKKLSCLNYYIEDDGEMYAEIDGTQKLDIKQRVLKHLELLRRIQNNEILPNEYTQYKEVEADTMSLFG